MIVRFISSAHQSQVEEVQETTVEKVAEEEQLLVDDDEDKTEQQMAEEADIKGDQDVEGSTK